MASSLRISTTRIPRRAAWDTLFVSLSGAHATALALTPPALVIGVLLWWNANTISHNFIHRPFFRRRAANRAYSAFLTLTLGFPQSLWRERHLRHHAHLGASKTEAPYVRVGRFDFQTAILLELLLLATLWTLLATFATPWFLTAYLPGWAIGLGLCHLQGHYEHARGTTSHYGRVYNFLFFNDGLHAEHHRRPGAHWTELVPEPPPGARASRWPPVLRWLDTMSLEGLERIVLRSRALQRFVLAAHERAFRRLLPAGERFDRVTIVGGGLFPRTAIVLRRLLPHAEITIVDASAEHLDLGRRLFTDCIDDPRGRIRWVCRSFDPGETIEADLVVLPLSFNGERRRIYERPPAPVVLVHDWIVSRHGPSVVVSWLLLKRLNLIVSREARLRRS